MIKKCSWPMPLTSLWVNWALREVAPKMSSSSRNQRDTSYVFRFVFKKIFMFCVPLAFLMITQMTLVHTFQRKRKEIYPRHPSKALRVTPVDVPCLQCSCLSLSFWPGGWRALIGADYAWGSVPGVESAPLEPHEFLNRNQCSPNLFKL